jgi:hypothetical protein
MSLNTKNQNPNKIVDAPYQMIGSLTCYYNDDKPGVNIQLTSLEEMWYGHEENIDHPEDSNYPTGVNEAHLRVMVDRVADSVLNRTGIDISTFDGVIHASSSHADNFSIQNV